MMIDEVRFVLDQHAELDFYNTSSLKQQSADRHIAPLGPPAVTYLKTTSCISVKTTPTLWRKILMTSEWIAVCLPSPLKQQSADRHIAPLGHIILIQSQPVFDLSPYCCVFSGEATSTIFIVVGLTRQGLEPTIYRTLYLKNI
jgi:hypothetical protein